MPKLSNLPKVSLTRGTLSSENWLKSPVLPPGTYFFVFFWDSLEGGLKNRQKTAQTPPGRGTPPFEALRPPPKMAKNGKKPLFWPKNAIFGSKTSERGPFSDVYVTKSHLNAVGAGAFRLRGGWGFLGVPKSPLLRDRSSNFGPKMAFFLARPAGNPYEKHSQPDP